MQDSKTLETRRAFPATTDAAYVEDTLCYADYARYPNDRSGLKWKSAILLTNSRTTPKTAIPKRLAVPRETFVFS
ncbi:MAG: hypothetical protein GX594_15450 [Pirellulaceae bacterium]|nr:hypothetical protein [Pirellulaceae bacterium]